MTIRKGGTWGGSGALAADGLIVPDDAAARAEVEAARRQGRPPRELGLLGGDLCRTVGGRGDAGRLATGSAARLPVDVARATLDGTDHWFVAHLVARRRGWRGRFVVVMNADQLGEWRLGPRAHPGDGVLDATEGALPLRQRLEARRRSRTGDHLPHPALRTRRAAQHHWVLDRPVGVWLDGVRVGRAREIEVVCEPDALLVVV